MLYLVLGEELIRHGHNVTICSTDSSIKMNDKVKESGMKLSYLILMISWNKQLEQVEFVYN